VTIHLIGDAWDTTAPPEPTPEDIALKAFLDGDTDEIDPAAIRARLHRELRRCGMLELGIVQTAQELAEVAQAQHASMEMPTRLTEQYCAGYQTGINTIAASTSQRLQGILDAVAESET